ncbi:MAG: hypothetical protein R3F34_04325 [Planctomycetota bacterium]
MNDELDHVREAHLEPDFLACWRASRSGDADAFRGLVRERAPGVFAVRVTTLEWCRRFLLEIDARRDAALRTGRTLRPPNSMHEHGALLVDLGLDGAARDLARTWLPPLAARLFPEHGGATLDDHHAYLVEYARELDHDLGFHVDDSDVTFNLCLGDDFAGAELRMLGLRCDLHRQTDVLPHEVLEIEHEPGVAILHAGRHRHAVAEIASGRRRNLILWCRSSAVCAAREGPLRCEPWCGWPGPRAE